MEGQFLTGRAVTADGQFFTGRAITTGSRVIPHWWSCNDRRSGNSLLLRYAVGQFLIGRAVTIGGRGSGNYLLVAQL